MTKPKHILMIVENNTLPYDRRVWHEALAAREFGYRVSAICPFDRKISSKESVIDGVRIYRHPNFEGSGVLGAVLRVWKCAYVGIAFSLSHLFYRPF